MRLLEPLLFKDGRPVPKLELFGDADPCDVIAAHVGHFAVHERDGEGEHVLARDLLGVHKLFFAIDREGRVDASTYLIELLRAGHDIESVFSVPSGHLVRVHPKKGRYELLRWGEVVFGPSHASEARIREFAEPIRAALDRTIGMLVASMQSRPVYVSLSGGLDSTTIAVLAHERFTDVRAVTFALRSEQAGDEGTDLFFARRVATELGLPLIEVLCDPDDVLDLLDDVLVYGQDCRDFNVHCGLVNAAIGQALRELHPVGPRPVVLTGDTMNELFANYTPVQLSDREYYGLPHLDRGRLRRFLVGGLDSGDREVGILARFGVDTVQPYALCARDYAALPVDLVSRAGSRSNLVRAVMGDRIPDYVYDRPKVRAQVAREGRPGGTLALLNGRGIDQEHLERRFAELLGIDLRSVHGLFRAGYYRFSTQFPRVA